jgi:DNA-binding response OmpR family regulator
MEETPSHPVWVQDGFATLKLVHDLKPDLLILDFQLPA